MTIEAKRRSLAEVRQMREAVRNMNVSCFCPLPPPLELEAQLQTYIMAGVTLEELEAAALRQIAAMETYYKANPIR